MSKPRTSVEATDPDTHTDNNTDTVNNNTDTDTVNYNTDTDTDTTDSNAETDSADRDTDSDAGKDSNNDTGISSDTDTEPSDCGGGRYDPTSNLCWQHPRSANNFDQKNWQAAVDYCLNLSLGGSGDWELPSLSDLTSLLGSCDKDFNCSPCAESNRCTALLGEDKSSYWSSTSSNADKGEAWTVNFLDGTSYYNNGLPASYGVRCIRQVFQ